MHQLRAPFYRAFFTVLLTAAGTLSQTPPPATQTPTPPANPNAPEMDTKEAPALFKARVNLVLVPVVVRDSKGRTVGTYTKENFQLFDKGKPQVITRFSVEKAGEKAAKAAQTLDTIPTGDEPTSPPDIPERFIAYLFDDVHLPFGDLVRARDAANRQLASLKITERAALYTTSGQNQVEFTSDLEKLHAALFLLRPRSISDPGGFVQCPDIGPYMADLIQNHSDGNALSVAIDETIACNVGTSRQQADAMVRGVAARVLGPAERETRVSLTVLKDVVRRMSVMPGQRLIVLVSPGFLTSQEQVAKGEVIDRAIQNSVLINSLDARGLWVDPMVDASQPNRINSAAFGIQKRQYDRDAASAQADVLAELAVGTGGSFFQNNNDLGEGLRRLTVAPEFYYVLGFSPQNLKLDGLFHSLKATLKPPASGMDVQARKGYYAPKKQSNAEETAKEEIEEALFSREEMSELPVELHTQYFKASDKDATIAVLCRLDPKHLQLRKADGRNNNQLVIVAGLFDRDGNFVSGIQKTVDLKLKDETLAKLMTAGSLSFKTNFSVPPGTYMVRLVVRDSERQMMSALNGAVAIQ